MGADIAVANPGAGASIGVTSLIGAENVGSAGGNETRPINAFVTYMIKY